MPIYSQRCRKCGHRFEDFRTMSKWDQNPACPNCGAGTERMITSPNSTDVEYDKPVLSESMGVHPSQVEERRRMFPDIPHTDDGRVIIKSQSELRRISKALGYHDRNAFS